MNRPHLLTYTGPVSDLISIGDQDSSGPDDAHVTISIGEVGQYLPAWLYERGVHPDERINKRGEHGNGCYSLSFYAYGMERARKHQIEPAMQAAREAISQGKKVHLNCATGRVRSVSLAAILLIHEWPQMNGDQLLQQLVNIRPEALGGMEGDGNTLELMNITEYHYTYKNDLDPTYDNIKWLN